MKQRILVTGANGTTGREVITALHHRGVTGIVAAGSNAERTAAAFSGMASAVRLDLTDPATYDAALDGITKIYLMRPPAISDVQRHVAPFITRAAERGVSHIVFLSLQGVEHNHIVPHYRIEQNILASGVDYTFLRPSFFMQNLATTHRDDIRTHGTIVVPAGSGKTNFIDVRDIAEAAAIAFTEDGHRNTAYELTGSEALDYETVAAILSDACGKKIVYTSPSIPAFFFHELRRHTPVPFILVMIMLYTVARSGKAAGTTDTVRKLLKRDPITFSQFAHDYRHVWVDG
ncbi:MAG: SDR family oxidoreductase [Spirochaetes bacterium]|nr:SDR family oxidoreductase [Spirochaetota bacterium]